MSLLKELPVAQSRVVSRHPEMGRSSVLLECLTCLKICEAFTWSWSGHGGVRCGSGKHVLLFADFRNREPEP